VYVAGRGLILSDELPKSCSWFVLVKLERSGIRESISRIRFTPFRLRNYEILQVYFSQDRTNQSEEEESKMKRKIVDVGWVSEA
jgi:hypothetical protein